MMSQWSHSLRRVIPLCWIAIVIGLLTVPGPSRAEPAVTNPHTFRFGLSTRTLRGVNETDARAAVKVYTEALVRETVFPRITPVLFDSDAALKQALENDEVEGLSLTVEEYVSVRDQVQSVHVFNLPNQNPPGEEYVVLVHQSDPAQALRDLRGADLTLFDNSRTVAAERWVDVQLMQEGLPQAGEFFKSIVFERKLSAVVLPVFFKKNRVCLATRPGLETMTELNPQVGRNLRVIARSPRYISSVLCFARHVEPGLKVKLLEGISRMHERPSGQQILAIFQAGEQLVLYPESCLQSAFDLIATHQRLSAGGGDTNAPPPEPTAPASTP